MIAVLDFDAHGILDRAVQIQRLAYRIEADLIAFDGIPQLHETADDLRASTEIFVGYFVDDVLAGILSFTVDGDTLDIGRVAVHPDYFRRGVARSLVRHVETVADVDRIIVSTGAANLPARRLYDSLGYTCVAETLLPEGVEIARFEKLYPKQNERG